jgi:hypothetical protein
MKISNPHTFHIPVMGLAYTIDSPVKVARYGISSVVSIIEDSLIEKMREYYCQQSGEVFNPITPRDTDYRAKRITAYLNLLNRIVSKQVGTLKKSDFETGSDIHKYFGMLPEQSVLKKLYEQMLREEDPVTRKQMEESLRLQIKPGSIDVNIMTKLDKNNNDAEGNSIEDGSDAISSIRGYVNSDLANSAVILSAGMNPRLFNYMEKFHQFDADSGGNFNKRIVIKVSDYRSALIQGKMLAKKGLWVSEFRIESGLNCGGHAFATDGYLLGPILEEFKDKREELIQTLFEIYAQALRAKDKPVFESTHPIRITVQGGIGTHDEDAFLLEYYGVDGTGWGTPFLLVPEATTVDEQTLQLLRKAKVKDVVLSNNSPLGVRFHYLKGTTAEKEKFARIDKGAPGSPCTEKFLVSNTEFGPEPLCTASRTYQKKKIDQLNALNLPEEELSRQMQEVLEKECLCIGLSNAAVNKYHLTPFKKLDAVNVCPGPNIAYFSEVVSLKNMIDHIYGRATVLLDANRPHMFIKELKLYVDYWSELLAAQKDTLDIKRNAYVKKFHENLVSGIAYYRNLSEKVNTEFTTIKDKLQGSLDETEVQLNKMFQHYLSKVLQTDTLTA